VRIGSSVRGAIDLVQIADALAVLRDEGPDGPTAGLDAALAALSGRIRLVESTERNPDDIVRELWFAEFAAAGGEGADAGWQDLGDQHSGVPDGTAGKG
jgi:MoxR-like ATPase